MRPLLACLSLIFGLFLLQPALAQDEAEAGDAAAEEGAEVAAGASSYIDLKPAFVVNYGGGGRLRYLKTEISLRVGGGAMGPSAIRHHMPYIRHVIVMTLSQASEEDLSSMEGKEMLRQKTLERVREVLEREEGEQQVLDLLFNAFVVQR